MIIDDLFMAIGTANVNWRSHTNDTEIHLGVFDENLVDGLMGGKSSKVGQGIREARQNAWAEHLNISPESLIDPLASLQHWPSKPGRKVGSVAWETGTSGTELPSKEVLRAILRVWQTAVGWEILAVPLFANIGVALPSMPLWGSPAFDLGRVADWVPDAGQFVEHVVFNPRLVCQ